MELVEKAGIEGALKRNRACCDKDIRVRVSAHQATLTGIVDSL